MQSHFHFFNGYFNAGSFIDHWILQEYMAIVLAIYCLCQQGKNHDLNRKWVVKGLLSILFECYQWKSLKCSKDVIDGSKFLFPPGETILPCGIN